MKVGDTIWFMDSNTKRKAVIKSLTGNAAVIKFADRNGGIRISRSRLFESEEAIDQYILENAVKERASFCDVSQNTGPVRRRKNQYDYMR